MHIPSIDIVSQFDPSPSVRPWPVYAMRLSSCRGDGGNEVEYLVGTGAGTTMTVADLEAEFFNGALQAVDTTNSESILRFASTYGVIPSPALHGADGLANFRRRNTAAPPARPVEFMDLQVGADACVRLLNEPSALRGSLPQDWRDGRPRELSEIARAFEWGNRDALEVISLAEMAQSIRALQCATVIPMVYSYFTRFDKSSVLDAIEYLGNGRYFQQAGPDFFSYETGPAASGFKLTTFERLLEDDPRLRDAASTTPVDAQAAFYASISVEFPAMAQSALDYLHAADRAYRGIGANQPAIQAPSDDPFEMAYRRSRRLPPLDNSIGTLGEAIVSQYARVYSSPTPFRRCEYCGKIFKKYKEEKFGKNIRTTRFCKKSCGVLFNQHQKS